MGPAISTEIHKKDTVPAQVPAALIEGIQQAYEKADKNADGTIDIIKIGKNYCFKLLHFWIR